MAMAMATATAAHASRLLRFVSEWLLGLPAALLDTTPALALWLRGEIIPAADAKPPDRPRGDTTRSARPERLLERERDRPGLRPESAETAIGGCSSENDIRRVGTPSAVGILNDRPGVVVVVIVVLLLLLLLLRRAAEVPLVLLSSELAITIGIDMTPSWLALPPVPLTATC